MLLAPKTAQLVADAVCERVSPEDEHFLQEFSMDRFTIPGTPATAAATRKYSPRVQPAAAVQTPPVEAESFGTGAGAFLSEASPSEILEMERAALEGANDGGMLAALEGVFGEGMVQVEVSRQVMCGQTSAYLGASPRCLTKRKCLLRWTVG